MDRDQILLTPGPLTTTLRTKKAMLKDWGSWDTDFNQITKRIRSQLLSVIHGHDDYVVVPMQGSGTFSVEASINSVLPPNGHLLVLDNGAYCKRMATLTNKMGRKATLLSFNEREPVSPEALKKALINDASITHVGLIHCETGAGVLNPLKEISDICKEFNVGLIIDAMSSFGALPISSREIQFDALISASGKCLESVPGMGFIFIRKAILESMQGNSQSLSLDLYDQYQYMEKTGQWRFTPPTHVVAALAEALDQFEEEGGQPARLARYKDNCKTLVSGLAKIGLEPFLDEENITPIIVTFLAPKYDQYDFKSFYNAVKEEGFILYPGKLTEIETFRVGCIGAINHKEMRQVVASMKYVLEQMAVVK